MTLSIFHTDCPVKARNNYNLIPDPRGQRAILAGIRDQLQLNVALCVKHVLAVLTGPTSAMNIAQAL